jgi:hypothetical protein
MCAEYLVKHFRAELFHAGRQRHNKANRRSADARESDIISHTRKFVFILAPVLFWEGGGAPTLIGHTCKLAY